LTEEERVAGFGSRDGAEGIEDALVLERAGHTSLGAAENLVDGSGDASNPPEGDSV